MSQWIVFFAFMLKQKFNYHSTQTENDYLYNYDCMTVSNLMVQKKANPMLITGYDFYFLGHCFKVNVACHHHLINGDY